ncbi:MAG: hypothetical protein WD512_15230 [Candidatus Paceibacterota bacterium]
MTTQGTISSQELKNFGITASTSLLPAKYPCIQKWSQSIDKAVYNNIDLVPLYELEFSQGPNFIRVNLRHKHSWNLIKNLIIINIKNTFSYNVPPPKKGNEISITIEGKTIFKEFNQDEANKCILEKVIPFLTNYKYI